MTGGSTPEVRSPPLWGWQAVLSFAIGLALIGVLAHLADLDAAWSEIRSCDLRLAGLGALAHYATYVVRGARWRRVLRHVQKRFGTWTFGLLVFFYNFVDNLVPARLGDLYGAHLARINLGVSGSSALGSIVFLRMLDAWTVLGLAGWSTAVLFADRLPSGVSWAIGFGVVVAIVATALLLVFAVLGRLPTDRVPEPILRRIQAFRTGMWPRKREWLRILPLTIVVWALELVWIYLLTRAFGLELGLAAVVFVATISLLASAVPLTPSGLGFVELSLYGCLLAVGATSAVATSITVLNRLLDYWLHLVLGVAVWAARDRLGLKTWRRALPAEEGGAV